MATTPKALVHTQLSNTVGTLYTVPGATTTVVRHLRVVNGDATASYTFDLYRNGSADTNRITETVTVPAGGSWEDDVYIPLAATDTIQGKASVASKLTIFIGGAEIA